MKKIYRDLERSFTGGIICLRSGVINELISKQKINELKNRINESNKLDLTLLEDKIEYFEIVGDILSKNKSILSLIIANNTFQAKCLQAFFQRLVLNNSIMCLNVNGTANINECFEDIIEFSSHSTSLFTLDLDNNFITKENVKKLLKKLRRNKYILNLYIDLMGLKSDDLITLIREDYIEFYQSNKTLLQLQATTAPFFSDFGESDHDKQIIDEINHALEENYVILKPFGDLVFKNSIERNLELYKKMFQSIEKNDIECFKTMLFKYEISIFYENTIKDESIFHVMVRKDLENFFNVILEYYDENTLMNLYKAFFVYYETNGIKNRDNQTLLGLCTSKNCQWMLKFYNEMFLKFCHNLTIFEVPLSRITGFLDCLIVTSQQ